MTHRMHRHIAYCLGIFAVACASPPDRAARTPSPACLFSTDVASPQDETAVKSVLGRVEQEPLYTIPAMSEGLAECDVRLDAGALRIEYRFRKGGWLHVEYDARIEYFNREASFTLPPGRNSLEVLAAAERVAFGASGCGIDWQNPESQPSDGQGVTETVFRGDVCNCQARIRRKPGDSATGWMLRSAC
ncbi:MAG: hypothetical protein KF778_14495 [Rhodocyclaceae bacterium]|nr:hypothetical protein [Rhodocyclaceae bacterium]MBX3669606.1 hypothetical protein [Rhodocyclaceae bacterium]